MLCTKTSHLPLLCSTFRGDHDSGCRALAVDGVVVRIGAAGAGVARDIRHTCVVQGDQVAGVGDTGGRGQGRGPGHAAVAAAHRAQGTVGHAQVGQGKTADRFAEGDGHQ